MNPRLPTQDLAIFCGDSVNDLIYARRLDQVDRAAGFNAAENVKQAAGDMRQRQETQLFIAVSVVTLNAFASKSLPLYPKMLHDFWADTI